MFTPTRDQSRLFFIEAWRKYRANTPISPIETMAAGIVQFHPEYHALLESEDAVDKEFAVDAGTINPFLHLSLHLAIEEQLSIDQPPGIRAAFEHLRLQYAGDRHRALHDVLECLGETIWHAQHNRTPLDTEGYLECVRRKIAH